VATAYDTILQRPHPIQLDKGLSQIEMLFANFCDYAKHHYKYSATKVTGSEGATLLGLTAGMQKTVDCASLADAYILLANSALQLRVRCQRVTVGSHAVKWATKAGSKCFDSSVVGNIRTQSGRYETVARCVFAEHYFVEIAGNYYDPCLLTTYNSQNEVQSWMLNDGHGDYLNKLFRIASDPSHLLIRIPNTTNPKPNGFSWGFLLVETKDLDSAVYKKAFRIDKPMYKRFTHSVNGFLKSAHLAPWPEAI